MMIRLRSFRAALLALAFAAAPARAGDLETPEQFLQYLVQNRQDAALASYTVRPDGTPDPADPILFLNADRPMPLGSTIKIVVLAAYAREVAAGRMDPEQKVALRDWEDYYLPASDGGAHPAALEALEIPADRFGFARDRAAKVPLDTLAAAMIHFSDNAATDYLIQRIGRDNLRATIAAAGLLGQEVPLPILGIFLSWDNHAQGNLTWPHLQELLGASDSAYTNRVDLLTAAFQNKGWRRAEFQFLLAGGGYSTYRLESRAADALFPQGTAQEYARIMAGVVTGTFLSPEVSVLMRRHLEVSLPDHDTLLSFGFKGGSLAGVLTGALYVVPTVGDFAGKPHVSVLFQRHLPEEDWTQLQETFVQEIFGVRLGLDRRFTETVDQTLVSPR
jgi:D-alanyl-D-alanine carboxypeptidase